MKIILFFYIFFSSILFSEGFSDYTFNNAESSSMAGAIVSNEGGDWSLFNNPASLIEIDKKRFSVGYSNLYNQTYLPLSSFGVTVPYNNRINIGLKYLSFKVDYKGTELLNESMLGFVGSKYLLKDKNSTLSLGFSANSYLISFGKSSGTNGDGTNGVKKNNVNAFGLDIGILATLREKNRVGVFIKNFASSNIGDGTSNQDLPKKIDMGLSTKPYDNLMLSFSIEQLLGYNSPQFRSGIKYKINKMLCLNAGVQSNPNRLGLGFQIEKNKFLFSYGFLTHHVLPSTHQTNLGFSF